MKLMILRRAFLLSLVMTATAFAAPAELAPGEVRYLVNLRPGATVAGVAAAGARIEAQNGSSLTVVVPAVVSRRLAELPEVLSVVEMGVDASETSHPAVATPKRAATDAISLQEPAAGRKLTRQNATPLWASGQYVYDGAGNILAMGVTGGILNTYGKKSTFTYDAASRLTAATVGWSSSGSDLQETYSYDGFGNLTSHIRTSPDPITYPPAATPPRLPDPATNRETDAGSVYDEAGNETNVSGSIALTYDAFNQATSKTQGAAPPITYIYDVNEERIGIQQGGLTHWTIRDFDNKPLLQLDSSVVLGDTQWSATQWTWVESFVWSAGHMLAAQRPNKQLHYHLDHLGSPRVVSEVLIADNSKSFTTVEYAPYGEEITKSGGELLKFTGHERDYDPGNPANDGYLDYMHARYYDPRFGRFLAVDPKPRPSQLTLVQRWNRYAYARNNPMTLADNDGRDERVGWLFRGTWGSVMEHLSNAGDALQRIPVFSAGLRIAGYGGSVKAGPLQASAQMDVQVKAKSSGSVAIVANAQATSGVGGTQVGPRITASATVLPAPKVSLDAAAIGRVAPFGPVDSNTAKASTSGQVTVTAAVGEVRLEAGVDFGAIATVVHETEAAAADLVDEAKNQVAQELDALKDGVDRTLNPEFKPPS